MAPHARTVLCEGGGIRRGGPSSAPAPAAPPSPSPLPSPSSAPSPSHSPALSPRRAIDLYRRALVEGRQPPSAAWPKLSPHSPPQPAPWPSPWHSPWPSPAGPPSPPPPPPPPLLAPRSAPAKHPERPRALTNPAPRPKTALKLSTGRTPVAAIHTYSRTNTAVIPDQPISIREARKDVYSAPAGRAGNRFKTCLPVVATLQRRLQNDRRVLKPIPEVTLRQARDITLNSSSAPPAGPQCSCNCQHYTMSGDSLRSQACISSLDMYYYIKEIEKQKLLEWTQRKTEEDRKNRLFQMKAEHEQSNWNFAKKYLGERSFREWISKKDAELQQRRRDEQKKKEEQEKEEQRRKEMKEKAYKEWLRKKNDEFKIKRTREIRMMSGEHKHYLDGINLEEMSKENREKLIARKNKELEMEMKARARWVAQEERKRLEAERRLRRLNERAWAVWNAPRYAVDRPATHAGPAASAVYCNKREKPEMETYWWAEHPEFIQDWARNFLL